MLQHRGVTKASQIPCGAIRLSVKPEVGLGTPIARASFATAQLTSLFLPGYSSGKNSIGSLLCGVNHTPTITMHLFDNLLTNSILSRAYCVPQVISSLDIHFHTQSGLVEHR
jgi:hypothetical protein